MSLDPGHCDHEPVWCKRCLTHHMPMLVFGCLPVVSCPKIEPGRYDVVPSPQFPREVGADV